ncbi:MAG: tRNA (adenosine(37)-N6)-threonylcarbamoyltransferase complex dimerization subunit type 1 TsaB [Erythrobacter sp.]|nr:tRNA (adenosine(37)-N6)-threonylcarbamoyltransferase complex dimerization subunit type 1 TsaB [Erythrobacter sp.]
MRTLAIETATEACSIALFSGEELLAHDHRLIGRGHAEQLVPMIARLPEKGRADRILVSLGPGSFTGVRIGIATGRALGFAWSAELTGYPTLALVAAMAQLEHPEPVTVCMNGGHGEWFVQHFDRNGQPDGDAVSQSPESTRDDTHYSFVAGNKAEELATIGSYDYLVSSVGLPNAKNALHISHSNLTRSLTPAYGRTPDAKPQAPFTPIALKNSGYSR